MRDFLKRKLGDAAIGIVFEESLKKLFLVLLSTGVFGFITHGILQNYLVPSIYRPFIFTFICSLIGLGTIYLYSKLDSCRPKIPRIECDFHIIEQTSQYEYLDDNHMIYTRMMKVKARRDNLSEFQGKYTWSGKGKSHSECVVSGQHFDSRRLITTQAKAYSISLGTTLKKGEVVDIEFKLSFEDTEHKARPFLSQTIRYPTDKLTMRIKLPKSLKIKNAYYEPRVNTVMEHPFKKKELLEFDSNGFVSKTILRPNLLWHYMIYWHIPAEVVD